MESHIASEEISTLVGDTGFAFLRDLYPFCFLNKVYLVAAKLNKSNKSIASIQIDHQACHLLTGCHGN